MTTNLVPFQCQTVNCKSYGFYQYHPVGDAACVSCNQPLMKLEIVHLIQRAESGPINSAPINTAGLPGRLNPWDFCCEHARKAAQDKDSKKHPKRYTGEEFATTCYGCLSSRDYKLDEESRRMIKAPDEEEQLVN